MSEEKRIKTNDSEIDQFDEMESSSLVSVLIGTRDRPQPLLRCLNGILSQNYPKLEVLVLDDCSQEHNICDIVTNRSDDHRVKCFRSERQLGVAGGRNFLMREAKGEVFIIIDDDAIFANDKCIPKVADHLYQNPKVGLLSFKIIDHSGGRQDPLIPFSRCSRRKYPELQDKARLVSYYLGGAHALRREVIEQCGLYQENLMFGEEELDLAYRVIQNSFSILYTPEIVVHHYPEPSAVGDSKERTGAELYFHVRNRIWLAYKYLPFPYLPIYLLIWFGYYGTVAIRNLQMGPFFRGIRAGRSGLRQLQRTPVDKRAIAYLKKNFGRLWY
jgi:GT2 family glycosyltransferase